MTDSEKIVRRFLLSVIWISFCAFTLTGLLVANARTTYMHTGKETETVNAEEILSIIHDITTL